MKIVVTLSKSYVIYNSIDAALFPDTKFIIMIIVWYRTDEEKYIIFVASEDSSIANESESGIKILGFKQLLQILGTALTYNPGKISLRHQGKLDKTKKF